MLGIFCLTVSSAFAQTSAGVQGNGVVAAPTAAAYADLTNASNKMLADLHSAIPKARVIILYDANAFSVIPYYASATDLVRKAAAGICSAETAGTFGPRAIVPTLDFGTAAQGLAALVQLTVPTYSIQGQTLTLDNSALVGSFATAAKGTGYQVVNPSYLLPAVGQANLNCQTAANSNSLADLWTFANSESGVAQAKAQTNPSLKGALDAFQKLKDVMTTSADKSPPLLGRALTIESLAHSVEQPSQVAIIDMRLDAADIDSTTKTVLWWKKTRFSANIAAHYWIFAAKGSGTQFAISLVAPGYVNILRKDVDLKSFAVSGP
jgi:hypothetical protein